MTYRLDGIGERSRSLSSSLSLSRNSASSWAVSSTPGSGKIIGSITQAYPSMTLQTAMRNRTNLIPPLSQPKNQPSQSFMRSERGTARIVAQRGSRPCLT